MSWPLTRTASAVAVLTAGLVAAPSTPDSFAAGGSDPRAVAVLDRAAAASRTVPYDGVETVTRWAATGPTSLIVHVVHSPGVGVLAEVTPTASLTHGGRVLDASERRTVGLSVTQDQIALLLDHYRVNLLPPARVVGRAADVVGVQRPGGGEAARFWVDRATGLVLRRELVDEHGRLARAMAFLDLTVPRVSPLLPSADVPAMHPAGGRALDAQAMASLRRSGFRSPQRLPEGYRLVDARMLDGGAGGVLHLTYCDGLTAISVFQQRGRLAPGLPPSWRRATLAGHHVLRASGLPERVAWSADGVVFTLLADAPDDEIADVVAAWPHASPGAGLLSRLAHGLSRIASWLNPFA